MPSAGSGTVLARGIECRPIPGEAGAWTYLSMAPWPQLSPDGEPMGSFLRVGDVAMVQLSCQLDPPGLLLEDIRAHLRSLGTGGAVVMRPVAVSVVGVDVVLADAEGDRQLATTKSSGYPPHTAIFSLSLRGNDADLTGRALTGVCGLLSIRYRFLSRTDEQGVTTAEADVGSWFADGRAVNLQIIPATHVADTQEG